MFTYYEKTRLDSVRDGAIQRFEFCTELAWKTVREYLIEEGYTDINSTKSVMKTAFADAKTAAEVFENIKQVYAPLFKTLIKRLGE